MRQGQSRSEGLHSHIFIRRQRLDSPFPDVGLARLPRGRLVVKVSHIGGGECRCHWAIAAAAARWGQRRLGRGGKVEKVLGQRRKMCSMGCKCLAWIVAVSSACLRKPSAVRDFVTLQGTGMGWLELCPCIGDG